MDRLSVCLLLSAFCLPVAAQTQSVSVLVPIVGSVIGPNDVRWKTDVQLQNESREEMFVALRLPTAPDGPAIGFTLPPGGTQVFTDVVGEAFGLQGALSPLIVETMGKRSVRVMASVYAVVAGSVKRPEPIPIAYSEAAFPQRMLNGLSFSDVFRTNIGLINLGERDATFTLALQRLAGRNIAVTRVALPPNSMTHTPIQVLFPLITKGDDFNVVVETSGSKTYVYGSVIENTTSEARFIAPAIGAADSHYASRTAQ